MAQEALQRFELENNVETVSDADDLYRYDEDSHKREVDAKKWEKDPHFFKNVKISAIALLKMVMHARSGGSLEVMGLMQGYIRGDTMVVLDTFALPVEGTETRVNAEQQAFGYMCEYMEMVKEVGRKENVIGWYHSHPGYGCWLSGIDVNTQSINQEHQDPWLAIVVDPVRTMSAGKVEIGAFRCYPKNYTPTDSQSSQYQTIPLEKIEDFGVHAKMYYELKVSYFKSSSDRRLLEQLWNQYWINTLSTSPMISNGPYATRQMSDIAKKLEKANQKLGQSSRGFGMFMSDKKRDTTQIDESARDGLQVASEVMHGYMAQVVKDAIFNLS